MNPRRISIALRLLVAIVPSLSSSADLLDRWTWRNPLPGGNPLSAGAHGNGLYGRAVSPP